MDHVVYLDKKADELAKLLASEKTMILRGATGRKLPYGRVNPGDVLYFINNDGLGKVQARAEAQTVFNSPLLSADESARLIAGRQSQLQFTPAQVKRWAGKRFLILIEVKAVQALEPFSIDRSSYGNMDDWLPVGEIESVRTGAAT